ncbi:MAG: hypothetical protein ACI8VE_002720, partial [Natrialbaceae archaeon]
FHFPTGGRIFDCKIVRETFGVCLLAQTAITWGISILLSF